MGNFLNLDTGAGGGRVGGGSLAGGQRPTQLPSNTRGQGLADRGQGPGNRGQGLGDRGQGLGNRQGIGNGQGLGNRQGIGNGQGLGNRQALASGIAAGIGTGAGLALGQGALGQNRALGENRSNWSEWSQNRGQNWQQAVSNRQDFWNNWSGQRQDRLNNFSQNQDQRWDNINNAREDRQAWRDTARDDWQNYRNDMWDYRYDRADQIWDNVQDHYDDLFDDRWWGGWYPGYVAAAAITNPWWWWTPATPSYVTDYTGVSDPYYYDYGVNTVYQGNTVYVDGKPAGSTQEQTEKATALAHKVEEVPPPMPAKEKGSEEWLPLGVWALTQEEKGDAVMFFQISINKDGIVSGAYKNTLTGQAEPVIGALDRESQLVAWRIGNTGKTVIETGIFNLTKDATPVAIHFDTNNTQTWLMVRLPQPVMPDQPTKVEAIDRTPPPVTPSKTQRASTKTDNNS
ncbi:MAG: mu-protocadherin-cell-suface protein [Verrucomicrobia bacterium]|nr:mu-protocadherin-cell-suface protein [Verrucomicrobiota bacterium]